tara:strand:+ start:8989 stop:9186 length:198 start_codon:yes stop_codon:yes gene_type:complete
MNKICETCGVWQRNPDWISTDGSRRLARDGECRKHAPQQFALYTRNWKTTEYNDWCGDWEENTRT